MEHQRTTKEKMRREEGGSRCRTLLLLLCALFGFPRAERIALSLDGCRCCRNYSSTSSLCAIVSLQFIRQYPFWHKFVCSSNCCFCAPVAVFVMHLQFYFKYKRNTIVAIVVASHRAWVGKGLPFNNVYCVDMFSVLYVDFRFMCDFFYASSMFICDSTTKDAQAIYLVVCVCVHASK